MKKNQKVIKICDFFWSHLQSGRHSLCLSQELFFRTSKILGQTTLRFEVLDCGMPRESLGKSSASWHLLFHLSSVKSSNPSLSSKCSFSSLPVRGALHWLSPLNVFFEDGSQHSICWPSHKVNSLGLETDGSCIFFPIRLQTVARLTSLGVALSPCSCLHCSSCSSYLSQPAAHYSQAE